MYKYYVVFKFRKHKRKAWSSLTVNCLDEISTSEHIHSLTEAIKNELKCDAVVIANWKELK